MTTPTKDVTKRRVAIVGGGVTGLAAAWHLHLNCPDIDVQLFEADSRLGGHAHTISIPNGTSSSSSSSNSNSGDDDDDDKDESTLDVDVGFMIFNDAN